MFAAFALASVVIVAVPGVDMALVTRQVIQRGRRAAAVTLLGLLTAGITHASLAAIGLSAVLLASASAWAAVKAVGAAYLVGLGAWMLWSSRGGGKAWADGVPEAHRGHAATDWQRDYLLGLASNLTNPKMAVFFLTFLPQFVPPGPNAAWRTWLLGLSSTPSRALGGFATCCS